MLELNLVKTFQNNKKMEYQIKTDKNRVVLFGPSGSGKSTLLKMIAGFYNPDKGSIKINNKEIKNLPIYKRRIGYLPQEYTLFPHMTIKENILYGPKVNKIKINKTNFSKIIEKLGIKDKLSLMPYQISGGERQRVALARALMANPDILLLDEPFSSLDNAIKENLREMVVDILDETGTKAIFVTHDFDDAFMLGKEVYIIYNGKIIEKGSADKIFNYPKYVETAELVGFKNIFTLSEFKKIFKKFFKKFSEINLNDFYAIKPENIFLNLSSIPYETLHIKGEIKKIIYKNNILDIKVKAIDKIFSLLTTDKSSKKRGDEIDIFIHRENIIGLKKFFK